MTNKATNNGYCDEQVEGFIKLATAQTRLGEIAHLADRAQVELSNAKMLLSHGLGADYDTMQALIHETLDLVFKAEEIARRIEIVRTEVQA